MDEPTPLTSAEPAHRRVLHHLAEAWHRLGERELELRTWERLDTLFENDPAGSVAAACAAASLADYRSAAVWLERAQRAGTPPERLLEIRGRVLSRRDHRAAIAVLHRSLDIRPTVGCLNALTLLHMSSGDTKRGRAMAREAFDLVLAEAEPSWPDDHVDALVNAVLTRAGSDADELLGPALMFRSDRADLYELWSRRTGKTEDPVHRKRCSLRSSWSGRRTGSETSVPIIGEVEGTCAPDEFVLDVRLTRSGRSDRVALAINDGYAVSVRSGGDLGFQGKVVPDRSLPVVGDCSRVSLTWRPGESTIHLSLRGRPRGGVRFREDTVEVDGFSAWLPVAEHVRGIKWSGVHVRPAAGWELRLGEPADASWSPGFVMRSRGDASARERVAPAMAWFDKGMAVWSEQVGPADRPEPVVVRADSTFCYTRPDYVRIPSGLLDRPDQWPVLAHEAGHLWWGRPGQFEHEDAWMAEGLAEFTLHLLEDARPRLAYRRPALRGLGTLAAVPLAELWNTRQGPDGMAALRVKAGFFLSMLREVLGGDGFRSLLRDLLTWSRTQPLDAFTVLARAGADLLWFGEQWIHHQGVLEFGMSGGTEKIGPDRCRTVLDIETLGAFTPGAPLYVELELRSGERIRRAVRVETGRATAVLLTNTPPTRALLDPDRRWLIPEQPLVEFGDEGNGTRPAKETLVHAESQ